MTTAPLDDTSVITSQVNVAPSISTSDIDWALDAFASRDKEYELYANYLNGKHRRFWRIKDHNEFARFLERVSINFCPRVVGALTDRLRIAGFEGNTPADTPAAAAAWTFWQDRRLARYANFLHSHAVGYGDAYLLVWPDPNGSAGLYVQRAAQMRVRYDNEEPERITLAARIWRSGTYIHLNLYYVDRIEKYRVKADAEQWPKASVFEVFRKDGDLTWPVENTYGRVPVFHFAFEGGIGEYGQSGLRVVVPIQDDINISAATRAVVREYQGWPLRYAIGLSDDDDAVKVSPDRLLTTENDAAKFGQFDAAPLDPYHKDIKESIDHICGVTGIPPHLLHKGLGTPPSGEALRTAEGPLVSRVEDTQTDFGDVWEQAVPFALQVDRRHVDGQIATLWQPAYTRAEKDQVETLAIEVRDLGLPKQRAWKQRGWSDEEIQEMQSEAEMEGMAAADAFDRTLNRV